MSQKYPVLQKLFRFMHYNFVCMFIISIIVG